MADINILVELDRQAAKHAMVATEHEALAKSYRDAAALIRSSTGEAAVKRILADQGGKVVVSNKGGRKSGATSTMSMIRSVLSSSQKPLSPSELVARMEVSGWETQSENPVNTVRTALMRLVEKLELRRFDDGTYALSELGLARTSFGIEVDVDDEA